MSSRVIDNKINHWTINTSIIIDVQTFDSKILAQWIKSHREAKGLTPGKLAKLAVISKQYVSLLEKGDEALLTNKPVQPALDKVERIAMALGADVNEARVLAGYDPFPGSVINLEDAEFLTNYKKLSDGQQATIKMLVSQFLERDFSGQVQVPAAFYRQGTHFGDKVK